MAKQLLSRREVMRRTTWSAPTLWRRVKDGFFPPPVQIGPGRVAWTDSDYNSWESNLRRTDGSPLDPSYLSEAPK